MNAFGGRLPVEVFMQLVYKCGWAIRIVQDHLDALKIREPPRSEARARDDWQDAVSLLNLIKAQIKAMFFSPEEWFTAIHFALDGKTTATTTPSGSSDLQSPVRIPAQNFQPTVLGCAGVPLPASTVPREYIYNMSHDVDLGYLPDSAAMVLDHRDTRYIPLPIPPQRRPTPRELVTGTHPPASKQPGGGSAGGGGAALSKRSSAGRTPTSTIGGRSASSSSTSSAKTPQPSARERMLASELFSSPGSGQRQSPMLNSVNAFTPNPDDAWDDEPTNTEVLRHLQTLNDSLKASHEEVLTLRAERDAHAERLLTLQRAQADQARSTEHLARTAGSSSGNHPDQSAAASLLESIFQSVEEEQRRTAEAQQRLSAATAEVQTPPSESLACLQQRVIQLKQSLVSQEKKQHHDVQQPTTITPQRAGSQEAQGSRVLANDFDHLATLSLDDLMSTVGSASARWKNSSTPGTDLGDNILRSAPTPCSVPHTE